MLYRLSQHRQGSQVGPPTVAAVCDPDRWSAFARQWYMYKVGMFIAVSVLPTAQFYYCGPDLRTYIMCDLRGDVANMVKVDLPAAIKRMAVKDESTLVYLIKLSKMTQSPGTGIRSFVASLRGQVALCQYVAPLY